MVQLRSGECCLAEKTVQSKNLKLATDLVGNGLSADSYLLRLGY